MTDYVNNQMSVNPPLPALKVPFPPLATLIARRLYFHPGTGKVARVKCVTARSRTLSRNTHRHSMRLNKLRSCTFTLASLPPKRHPGAVCGLSAEKVARGGKPLFKRGKGGGWSA